MSLFHYIYKILFLVILFTISSTCFSETISIKGLVFSDLKINEVFANQKITSGYLTIENTNKKDEHLIHLVSNFSEKTELHNMTVENDIMKMKHVDKGITIKANSKLIFRPGSFHIMFIKLLKPLKVMNKYKVIFTFQNAGTILLEMPVKAKINIIKKHKNSHH